MSCKTSARATPRWLRSVGPCWIGSGALVSTNVDFLRKAVSTLVHALMEADVQQRIGAKPDSAAPHGRMIAMACGRTHGACP